MAWFQISIAMNTLILADLPAYVEFVYPFLDILNLVFDWAFLGLAFRNQIYTINYECVLVLLSFLSIINVPNNFTAQTVKCYGCSKSTLES